MKLYSLDLVRWFSDPHEAEVREKKHQQLLNELAHKATRLTRKGVNLSRI